MREINVMVNGMRVTVREGATVAAAILIAGETAFRKSVRGEPRGPLCRHGRHIVGRSWRPQACWWSWQAAGRRGD